MAQRTLARRDGHAGIDVTGASVHRATVFTSRHNVALPLPETQRIRIAIVAERLFGEALQVLLSTDHGLHVIGPAVPWGAARKTVEQSRPHVVLFDRSLADADPTELISLLATQSPDSKILLLTTSRDARSRDTGEICRALKAGAKGYVSKDAGLADLTKAIRGVHHGEIWVERRLIADLLAEFAPAKSTKEPPEERRDGDLTIREREILRLLASGGGTNRHIAQTLFISEKTVKTHLKNIFRKLNVTRRLQAVLYAVGHGLSTRA